MLYVVSHTVPSQPPENVRALSITSDVAVISWSEPPRSSLNGVLKGYRVIYWSLYPDGGEFLVKVCAMIRMGVSQCCFLKAVALCARL